MLGFELDALLASKLARDNRPPDGRLHPSGDLLGSLRHSQLRAAGAPTIDGDIVSSVRLMTGTMWHSYFEDLFRGKPAMLEVKLDRWLPEGWSGTADWIVWNDELQGFVLGDLKTIKGEGIRWVARDGIKLEHQWQVSAYWWALLNAGFPMVEGYVVYYLPQNQVFEKGTFADVKPLTMEGTPIKEEIILPVMQKRWELTDIYLKEVRRLKAEDLRNHTAFSPWDRNENYLSLLAPVQERVQKRMKNQKADGQVDVVLVPHWSASYCPYPTELCDCREMGTTKIGHYDKDGEYHYRKGYEHVEPSV